MCDCGLRWKPRGRTGSQEPAFFGRPSLLTPTWEPRRPLRGRVERAKSGNDLEAAPRPLQCVKTRSLQPATRKMVQEAPAAAAAAAPPAAAVAAKQQQQHAAPSRSAAGGPAPRSQQQRLPRPATQADQLEELRKLLPVLSPEEEE